MGHASTFIAYDVLQRRLRSLGYLTQCVRNVTDVDDDLLSRARSLGVHYLYLAARSLAVFEEDMKALGLFPPHSEPRATSAISEVRQLVGQVLDSGHAYISGGSVYFDVSTAPRFGELSSLTNEEMLQLASASGGHPNDKNKRNKLDFVLWQRSLPGEPEWTSRWGPGRPGWHIECSALALRAFGNTIDIHGGGSDLIFPHHECEQAQSEAVTGKTFVKHWMHSGSVNFAGEKMSKSHGNLVFVSEIIKKWDPMVIRLAILSNHYRSSWEWDNELLVKAQERLNRWKKNDKKEAGFSEVGACLDDDLDTQNALKEIDRISTAGNNVSEAASLLGIFW